MLCKTYCSQFRVNSVPPIYSLSSHDFSLYRFFLFVITLTLTGTPVTELYTKVLGSLTRKLDIWKTLAMEA